jgi:ribonuclease D
MEVELEQAGRLDWFEQSCRRAVDMSLLDRTIDADEEWRITGSGKLRGRAAAVLRELWRWRNGEAAAVDRPPFHILQNGELIHAAERFNAGETPEYRHFSSRRRQTFLDAAQRGLRSAEADWPVLRRRFGTRPTPEILRRTEDLRQRRDRATTELGLDPSFVAPRSALEAIAMDPSCAENLLVPWQRRLLDLAG